MALEGVLRHIDAVGAIIGAAAGILTALRVQPRVYFNPVAKKEPFTYAVTGAALAGTAVAAVLSLIAARSSGATAFPWFLVIAASLGCLVGLLAIFSWISTYATFHVSINGTDRPVIGGLWRAPSQSKSRPKIQDALKADPTALDVFFSRSSRATAYSLLVVSCVGISTSISSSLFFSTAWLSTKGESAPAESSLRTLAEEIQSDGSILKKPQRSISYRALPVHLKNAAEGLLASLRASPATLLTYDGKTIMAGVKGGAVVLLAEEAAVPRKVKARELVESALGSLQRAKNMRSELFGMSLLKAEVIESELASSLGDDASRQGALNEAVKTLNDSETLSSTDEERGDLLVRKAKLYYARARPSNAKPDDWDSAALTAANTIVNGFDDRLLKASPIALSTFLEVRLRYTISERGKDSSASFLTLRAETLEKAKDAVVPLLSRPASAEVIGALTTYGKIAHDQAYAELDPQAPEATQKHGLELLVQAETAMELAVAYLEQGDVPAELSALHGDFLLDLARSRALHVEYLTAHKFDTVDARHKIAVGLKKIDSTNVTSVEKRYRLLSELVKRPEWMSVCNDKELRPLVIYAASYTESRNGCK